MSTSISSLPFWQGWQNWHASQAISNSGFVRPTSSGVFDRGTARAQLDAFGTVNLNASMSAAILAAQEALNRVNQAVTSSKGVPTKSVADVDTQVTFSGSLSGLANFGAIGPSSAGGFQFLSGSALKTAFSAAMIGQTSNGAAIDTVSVSGNTLTASTSGTNAHAVFTLSLKPDSGLFTFRLVNPIDLPVSKLDTFKTLDLSGLVQAVKADGTTIALPNSITIQVHNGQGPASGTATSGAIHQGGLAFTPPSTASSAGTSRNSAKYTPPINPLTGHAYTASFRAAAATSGAINIFV